MKANGRFTLCTDEKCFPNKNIFGCDCERRFWFAKDGGEGYWIGFTEANKKNKDKDQHQKKWILFTRKKILYIAPIAGKKVEPPRQGRWELSGGSAPAPTVNLQPLPEAFQMSGCKGSHDCLNGEYLPLDDGKLMNERPIFKHTPVMGAWVGHDKYRMHWFQGAWRIYDKEHLHSNQRQCIAFASDDAIHPTALAAETVWKATATDGHFGSDLEFLEGITMATGTVCAL